VVATQAATRRPATAALLLALVSVVLCPVVAVPVVALVVATRARRGRRPRAGAAQIIAVVALVLGVALDVVLVVDLLGGGEGVDYRALRTGDCIRRPPDRLSGVDRVPCGRAHDLEVVMVGDDPAVPKAAYPGKQALVEGAAARCAATAAGYDAAAGGAALRQVEIVPDLRSWDKGVRRVVCTVGRSDGRPLPGRRPAG
jgi:hypothetical protein